MNKEIEKIEKYYSEHGPMILRRCRAILKDEAMAYDAMHDIFVKLLSNPVKVKYTTSYLYKMATNHSLNILKRSKKITNCWEVPETIDSFDLEEKVLNTLELNEIFKKVPQTTRVIAELRYLSMFKLEEIAEAVGMSQSGVRKRLRKLKEVCNKELLWNW